MCSRGSKVTQLLLERSEGRGGRGVCLTSDLRVNIDKVWGRYHIVVVLFKNAFITGY